MRIAILVALLISIAPPALAQGDSRSITMPLPGRIRISAQWDTLFHTGTDGYVPLLDTPSGPVPFPTVATFTSWSNVLTVDVDMRDAVFRAILPFTYEWVRSPVINTESPALGNIALEGFANVDLGAREHRLLMGGGLSLPTADPAAAPTMARLIAWEASFRNAPIWTDSSLTLSPAIDYRLAVPWLWVQAIAAVPLFIPTSGRGGPLARGAVEVMLSLDVTVALRLMNVVDLGVSFLAWTMPSGVGYSPPSPYAIDLGQTAVTVRLQTDPEIESPLFGGAELIVDLDREWGPTGTPGKVWGLRGYIGGRIDV